MYNDFFNDVNKYYENVIDSKEGISLFSTLIRMQKEKRENIDEKEAEENAKMCILLCRTWNGITNTSTENARKVFLDYVDKFDEKSKRILLSSIEYTFKNSAQLMESQENINENIASHIMLNYDNDNRTTEEIKESVLAAIDEMVIPPRFFEYAIKNAEKYGDYKSEFAKISDSDMQLKCIASMECFLEDENLTMNEAVKKACFKQDLRSICEDASDGLITREEALFHIKRIAKAALIFAGICAAIFLALSIIEAVLPVIASSTAATATSATAATTTSAASAFAPQIPAVFAEIAGVSSAAGSTTAAASAAAPSIAAGSAGALMNVSALPDTNILKQILSGSNATTEATNLLHNAFAGDAVVNSVASMTDISSLPDTNLLKQVLCKQSAAKPVVCSAELTKSMCDIKKLKSFFGNSFFATGLTALFLDDGRSKKIAHALGKNSLKNKAKKNNMADVLKSMEDTYRSSRVTVDRRPENSDDSTNQKEHAREKAKN